MSEADTEQPDPFLAAFDKLSSLGETPTQSDVDNALTAAVEPAKAAEPAQQPLTPPPAAEPQPAAESSTEPAAEPATESASAQPTEGQSQPASSPSTAESDDELLRRLSALVKQAPQGEAESPPASQTASQDAPPETNALPPIYSKDEEEFLSTYEKEWPDVARAEALRRRAEYRDLASFIFQEIAGYLKPHLEQLQVVATRTHLSDLEAKVPDYDDVRDKVIDWVAQQPKYLQSAYQHVIEHGTTDEVIDLIGRWRAATGATTQGRPQAAQPSRETALPPATKQAAAALAPVGSKRSAPAAGVDPMDFDGAFALAAADKD